jgi:hypothetical protein
MKHPYNTIICVRSFIVILFLGFFMLGQVALAQSAADEPCDPDYWKSLKARAWLEAQREITQNQNLIFKPDSVLEYTCFDKYSAELAQHAIDMFSETTKWGTLLPSDSMDKALEEVVGKPFRSYLNSNFELSGGNPSTYDLLGGRLNRGGQDDGLLPKANEGQDYDSDDWVEPIRGGDYRCKLMNEVWHKAKCMDFIDNKKIDGFYTFKEYQNALDKRRLPKRCSPTGRWVLERRTALTNVPWTEDAVETYLDFLDSGKCGNNNFPAFPTGLTVYNKGHAPFAEKICIQPGCHYQPGAGCVSS